MTGLFVYLISFIFFYYFCFLDIVIACKISAFFAFILHLNVLTEILNKLIRKWVFDHLNNQSESNFQKLYAFRKSFFIIFFKFFIVNLCLLIMIIDPFPIKDFFVLVIMYILSNLIGAVYNILLILNQNEQS